LQEEVAHFVELVGAFGDGAAGLYAGDEVGESFQVGEGGVVGGRAMRDAVAEDYYEGGEGGLEDGPGVGLVVGRRTLKEEEDVPVDVARPEVFVAFDVELLTAPLMREKGFTGTVETILVEGDVVGTDGSLD
jgi:hypothetical protein